jgi:hypothetical protein
VLAKLYGLDSVAWTAIGTISLSAVTLAYVILTFMIARRSGKSADAAERSAAAAERSAEAIESAAAEERERRRREEEASRVRLMRGLLTEVKENLDIGDSPSDDIPFYLPFVRDVWASVKDRIGDLPDEVIDAVGPAYAQAFILNWLREIHISRGQEQSGYTQELTKATDYVRGLTIDLFSIARDVLEHWIRMKEEPHVVESREGPSL